MPYSPQNLPEKEKKRGDASFGSSDGYPVHIVPISKVDDEWQKTFTKNPKRFFS
jgi:hypothetical protein